MPKYRWNDWNTGHIAEHGITPAEAEYVIDNAGRGYPIASRDGKFLVRGQTQEGAYIQTIFIRDPDGTAYVIHARPLNDNEKRQYRQRR